MKRLLESRFVAQTLLMRLRQPLGENTAQALCCFGTMAVVAVLALQGAR
jgi:hypothetical protein